MHIGYGFVMNLGLNFGRCTVQFKFYRYYNQNIFTKSKSRRNGKDKKSTVNNAHLGNNGLSSEQSDFLKYYTKNGIFSRVSCLKLFVYTYCIA